jgi:hypothetical protein
MLIELAAYLGGMGLFVGGIAHVVQVLRYSEYVGAMKKRMAFQTELESQYHPFFVKMTKLECVRLEQDAVNARESRN